MCTGFITVWFHLHQWIESLVFGCTWTHFIGTWLRVAGIIEKFLRHWIPVPTESHFPFARWPWLFYRESELRQERAALSGGKMLETLKAEAWSCCKTRTELLCCTGEAGEQSTDTDTCGIKDKPTPGTGLTLWEHMTHLWGISPA